MIVDVYRNLNNGLWSVRHKGKVIAHAEFVCIKPIKFHVGESGRKRVLKKKQKNVHAWVKGELIGMSKKKPKAGKEITYDPYAWPANQSGYFFSKNGTEVFPDDFDKVCFDANVGKAYGY